VHSREKASNSREYSKRGADARIGAREERPRGRNGCAKRY
jgi:hypothetical protein